MNIFEKFKRFIRKIFVDYKKIDGSINKNVKALEEKIIDKNNLLKNEIMTEAEKKINNTIMQIKEENQQLKTAIEKDNENLRKEINKFEVELYNLKDLLSYSNTELLHIKYDKSLKNILIIGFYGAPNLGDELMLETLLDYLYEIPNIKISILLADNPNYSIDKYKNIRFIHYPKSLNDFNILAEEFDYFIFGGGAIIDDSQYEKENSYQYDLGTILIKLSIRAIAFKKKVVCLALSASKNISNEEYLKKLSYVIHNSYYFSVRDEFTKKYLTEKLGNEFGNEIKKIHDIVFSNKELLSNLSNTRIKNEQLNIGIIAISNDENYEKMQIIINSIKRINNNAQINLIPFYDYKHNDIIFYNKLMDNNKDIKINIEKYSENMDQTIDAYKKNDIIIGMRYHSILIAYALNIPCISICYDIHIHYPYKIKYLNQIFDKKDALSYINLNEDKLYKELNNILNDYDENKYLKISKQILTEAEEQMKELINITLDN